MSKRKLKIHRGTVYRSTVLPSEIQDTLRLGATFSDRAFLSSSSKKSNSFYTTEAATLFEIESKMGVDISSQSKYKHEAEVLFWPSTMFMVKSMKEENGCVTMVTMEELT